MKKYLLLLLVTLAAGAALARIGASRREAPRPESAAATRDTALTLTITEEGVTPPRIAVPVGTRVRLDVVSAARRSRSLKLGGYETRVSLTLAPGMRRRLVFVADRPGDDFPWWLDGAPTGRLDVTGSHLPEGHR